MAKARFPLQLALVAGLALCGPAGASAQPGPVAEAASASSADGLAARLIDLRRERREVGQQRAAVERATADLHRQQHEIATDEIIPLVETDDDLAPLVETPSRPSTPDPRLGELNRRWSDLRTAERILDQRILEVSEQASAALSGDGVATGDPADQAYARTQDLIRQRDAAQARREAATRRAMAELVDLDDDGLEEAWSDLDAATARVQDIDADLNSHVARTAGLIARAAPGPTAPLQPKGDPVDEPADGPTDERLVKACLEEQAAEEKKMIEVGQAAARCEAAAKDPEDCDRRYGRAVELAAERLNKVMLRCAGLQGDVVHHHPWLRSRRTP